MCVCVYRARDDWWKITDKSSPKLVRPTAAAAAADGGRNGEEKCTIYFLV